MAADFPQMPFQSAWKNCRRQADLHEAMVAGRPDEVARISDIVCQHSRQREVSVVMLPSMVTNS